jgi:MFS family permease
MGVIMVSQMQWFVLAPVARAATKFYGERASATAIDLLTLIFPLGFLIFAYPAFKIVDRFGLQNTLRLSAIVLASFSLVKGIGGNLYWLVLISQIALAFAYTLIVSSVKLIIPRWFPLPERGFATGLVTLAHYLGLILIMVVSPLLVKSNPHGANYGEGVRPLLFYLGLLSVAFALALFFLFKESPPTPPSKDEVTNESLIPTIKFVFTNRSLLIFTLIFGLVWGLFNAFIAKIDGLTVLMGIGSSNGFAGLVLLGGGLAGTMVIPYLSDFFKKRKLFFFISLVGIFLSTLAFTFMPLLKRGYILGYIAAGFLGFFSQSAIPLGLQYGTELSQPQDEFSIQTVLLLKGQLGGSLLILLMGVKDGALFSPLLLVSAVLLFLASIALLFIEESSHIITEEERFAGALEETIKGG